MQGTATKMLLAAALMAVAIAGKPTPAIAGAFDGEWTVVVITEHGKCDHSYSYDVRVLNGVVYYHTVTSVSLSGTVSPSGQVRVAIRHHEEGADGSGHLAAQRGGGGWRGSGKDGVCSGRWVAERR
jgi:hypothetical protein